MSTVYGSPPYGTAPGGATGRADFGWISEAWRLFSQSAGTWVVAVLIFGFLPLLLFVGASAGMGVAAAMTAAQSSGRYNPTNPFAIFGILPAGFLALVVVFGLLYVPFMFGGIYRMAVKQVRGELISISDVFGGGPVMLPMLGLIVVAYVLNFAIQLILGLFLKIPGAAPAVGAGPGGMPTVVPGAGTFFVYFLEIIGGLFLYTALLPSYGLVADGRGVLDALRLSLSGMAKDIGRGALLLFVFFLIYLVSAIPCGLGLLATLPMWFLLSALAYRDMIGMPGMVAPSGSVYGQPQPGVWPPPPAAGQAPPVWGQTPTQAPPPGNSPPRTSLSGEPMDEPPGSTPPGGRP